MDVHFEIKGLKELDDLLHGVSDKVAAKYLRSSLLQATTPTMRRMKAMAPVGTKPHKTYKGRVVSPGFLKRSIKRKTGIFKDKSGAYCIIGVKPEAFYGVTFLDRPGGYNIMKKGKNAPKYSRGSARLTGHVNEHPWFRKTFENESQNMLNKFKEVLSKKLL